MSKKHGSSVGIEFKIEYHPVLDVIGEKYESWRRTSINWLQNGMSEDEVEKRLQRDFNLQWAWADSIATEAAQCLEQLKSSKDNQITQLKERIKAKSKKAKTTLKRLLKELKNPFNLDSKNQFALELIGLKSKRKKIESLKKELTHLENSKRLHICFGSKKLFHAQHHLEDNNYSSRKDWLTEWKKKRSGRFYCIGKSQEGGGTMLKIFPVSKEGDFELKIKIPRPLQSAYGQELVIPFKVTNREGRPRLANLNYAIDERKPITTQIFRRENKGDQWYGHLTTYVSEVPWVYSKENGCIGLDFNKDHISVGYVKPDGNIKTSIEFPFKWKQKTTGQRQAMMRDIVADIIKIAETYQCAIAIESLDFRKKKAKMAEESNLYNEMLSNLSTGLFRTSIESRCKRYGVELIKVNPAFTSVIGMIKFMSRYGLNSGTAAAMVIARRAMKMSERAPKCLVRPEDQARHSWTTWNRLARFLKDNKIQRSNLFNWMKTLEDFLVVSDNNKTTSSPSLASNQLNRKPGKSPSPNPKLNCDYVQLCLGF